MALSSNVHTSIHFRHYYDLYTYVQMPYKLVSDFGRPGEFVVHTANENQATMVIMGTRGMGKVRRTILGSVSDYVVHHAHCAVLIARN